MARLGCGALSLGIGAWILLWAFDLIPFSPRFVWLPLATVLVAIGLRLLLVNRK